MCAHVCVCGGGCLSLSLSGRVSHGRWSTTGTTLHVRPGRLLDGRPVTTAVQTDSMKLLGSSAGSLHRKTPSDLGSSVLNLTLQKFSRVLKTRQPRRVCVREGVDNRHPPVRMKDLDGRFNSKIFGRDTSESHRLR